MNSPDGGYCRCFYQPERYGETETDSWMRTRISKIESELYAQRIMLQKILKALGEEQTK